MDMFQGMIDSGEQGHTNLIIVRFLVLHFWRSKRIGTVMSEQWIPALRTSEVIMYLLKRVLALLKLEDFEADKRSDC